MELDSELIIDVLDNFKALQDALSKLKYNFLSQDIGLASWFQSPNGLPQKQNSNYREQAFNFLIQLEYLDHQNPKEILVGSGLFAATQSTIDTIKNINNYKEKFKQSVIKLKNNKISISNQNLTQSIDKLLTQTQRSNIITKTLHRAGLARLHLKQCYRRIPILELRPDKVSWTWANTRAITKITVFDAEQKLLKQKTDTGIQMQLAKLRALKFSEPLAIVQELAPHLRANILTKDKTNNDNGNGNKINNDIRKMIKGAVPIFYLESNLNNSILPKIIPPKEKRGKDEKRVIRKDVKLDPHPFLPAIRVHKYL